MTDAYPVYEYEQGWGGGWEVYRRNMAGQRWGCGMVYKEKFYAQQVCDFLNGYKNLEGVPDENA